MQLAVIVIHGMGSQSRAFAAPMIAEVSDRLAARGLDPAAVTWRPVHWADILASRQAAYVEAARQDNELDFLALRRFIVGALGDAAAYQYVEGPSGTYVRIHDRIREQLHELYTDDLDQTPVPLVVMGHSLGSHIISSYIWDSQRGAATGAGPTASPFERFEHLAAMVTFGSNIPLFTFAYDPVRPIDFPGGALAPGHAERARWLNFYDRDDVLGYPLRPTSPAYAAAVDADLEVNVGSFGVAWTPLSHNGYWTDDDFTRPVADLLADLLAA